ncbi:MAG: lipase family protein [Clostridia bacterium]|nr:lipase family protein [Clostridia bacterium]
MNLYQLFYECVHIPYLAAGCCANYAVRRELNTLYIFFEKSVGKADWKSNFDFPAATQKRMGKTVWFAHRGFLAVWKEIEPRICGFITDESVRKIVIVGYSHGAAVAVLCHEYVWFHRPDLRDTLEGYGFGCPRVFWGVRREELMRRWERFTVVRNIDDIVTHVPPFIFGYSHVGNMLKIGARGKYSRVDAHREENILRELEEYEGR